MPDLITWVIQSKVIAQIRILSQNGPSVRKGMLSANPIIVSNQFFLPNLTQYVTPIASHNASLLISGLVGWWVGVLVCWWVRSAWLVLSWVGGYGVRVSSSHVLVGWCVGVLVGTECVSRLVMG